MARQLWLLRHGEAEPHDARSDDERRLTARGENQSRAAGRALAAMEIVFQAVYTSPKVRARHRAACL
jgi:phosphohistidine phosphatase